MNNNDKSTTVTGLGFSALLTLVFITLKLCKVINWSWWWVLSPLWIGTAVGLLFLGFYFVMVILIGGKR
jgi:hypothetical protein